MTLRRFCNVIYAYLVAGVDNETREKFDRDLNAPLAGWAETQRRILAIVEGDG